MPPDPIPAPVRAKHGFELVAAERPARAMAVAFLLYGLLAVGLLATILPPFQNPDETTHFARAAQVADRTLLATRFPGSNPSAAEPTLAGGLVYRGILEAYIPFAPLHFHPERQVTRAGWPPDIHWSRDRMMLAFPNTALYPPVFYLPAALAIRLGRVMHITVVDTLILSRILTGLAAVAVGAWAIAIAGGAAPWLFAILTLPMSLSLIASPSQDALMLACSAMAGAMSAQALRRTGGLGPIALAGLALVLTLVVTARPPYATLALVPLALPRLHWRARVAAALAVLTCAVAWSAIAAHAAWTNFGAIVGADPPAQIALLRADPALALRVAFATLTQYWDGYVLSFVGQLGWGDTALPEAYHLAAQGMLGVAAVATILACPGAREGATGSGLAIAAALLLAGGGLFAAQYLTWTAPGAATVIGVQGRYFLPLALIGAGLFPAFGHRRIQPLRTGLMLILAAFPVVTLSVVVRAIVLRYYFT